MLLGKAVAGYLKRFERWITTFLLWMMAVVVLLSIADLTRLLIADMVTPPFLLVSIGQLLDVFGMFLLVLIGIELLETLDAYVHRGQIRAEIIVLVAIIALARKVITLDVTALTGLSLFGIAALVLSLGVTYWFIRRRRERDDVTAGTGDRP